MIRRIVSSVAVAGVLLLTSPVRDPGTTRSSARRRASRAPLPTPGSLHEESPGIARP